MADRKTAQVAPGSRRVDLDRPRADVDRHVVQVRVVGERDGQLDHVLVPPLRRCTAMTAPFSPPRLFEDADVPPLAHLLQHARPGGHAHLAEVRLAEQQHRRPRLAIPAPMESGMSSRRMAWWYGSSRKSSWPKSSSWCTSDSFVTRMPPDISSCRRRVTEFQTRVSPSSRLKRKEVTSEADECESHDPVSL